MGQPSSSAVAPQTQRIMLSSSSSSALEPAALAASSCAAPFLLPPLPLAGALVGAGVVAVGVEAAAGRSSRSFLVCWPLVARPERRGSSVRFGD